MYPSLEDVAFLARSESRTSVLEAITESPRARHELRELTGASRVTVNRILDDLEDRNWIVRENGRCEPTPLGTVVAEEFTRLLDNLGTLDHLGDHVNWMHIDRFDFDLHRLRDATVITPTWDDFAAYTNTLIDLVYDSTAIRAIGTGLHREFVKALADATINGDLSLELIYTPAVIDAILSEADLTRLVRDLADVEGANLYRYLGENPLMMLLIHETTDPRDDVTLLCGQHEEDAPPGTVETPDERVRSWAEGVFESVRADSTLLEVDVLRPGRPETT